jgi:hypothetical protein
MEFHEGHEEYEVVEVADKMLELAQRHNVRPQHVLGGVHWTSRIYDGILGH